MQGKNSDVTLTIPKGMHCSVVGHVHTYTQELLNNIPEGEWLVAPIPEYTCQVNQNEKGGMFEIKLRHCAAQNWENIIVRCGDFRNQIPFSHMPMKRMFSPGQGSHYTVDNEFITIYTSHFCQFLCTVCGEECEGEIQALLFGTTFRGDSNSLIHTSKLYLCGPLYSIQDYRQVKESSSSPWSVNLAIKLPMSGSSSCGYDTCFAE